MPKSQHDLFDFVSELDVPVGPSGMAEELLKEVLARRASFIAKLANGNCKSMEAYADAVGNIRSIDFVLGFAQRKQDAIGTPILDEDSMP